MQTYRRTGSATALIAALGMLAQVYSVAAPQAAAQVRIDDPDDPFSQRRRRRPTRHQTRARAHGWLGVGLGPELIKAKDGSTTTPGTRVAIRQVFPGSGALAAGLVVGDVVLSVGGVDIVSVNQLVRLVAGHPVATKLIIIYERARKRHTVIVTLGVRPSHQQMVKSAWLGKKLPETFAFTAALGGAVHTLKEFRGNPLIIEYWATYCGPCKRAAPWLVELTQRYKHLGLRVIKISNETPETVRKHLRRAGHLAGHRPLVLLDSNDLVRRKLHLSAMPTFLYVDATGVVRSIGFGARTKSQVEQDLQPALPSKKIAPKLERP